MPLDLYHPPQLRIYSPLTGRSVFGIERSPLKGSPKRLFFASPPKKSPKKSPRKSPKKSDRKRRSRRRRR